MIKYLSKVHRHQVVGLQAVPTLGPALVVVHHSFATYDIALLAYAIYGATGRLPRALVDRLFFKSRLGKTFIEALGSVEGHPDTGAQLLAAGELVVVAPGGMREAMRSSRHKRVLQWGKRRGFARLALTAQVPIVVAACPAADDLYTLYENPLTDYFLNTHHLPVPLLRGLGPTLLPRPVALTHFISGPIVPPPLAAKSAEQEAQVDALVQNVSHALRTLLRR
jgi:1-acyl-sn-glycerol-3-phosphate acyltransferase